MLMHGQCHFGKVKSS